MATCNQVLFWLLMTMTGRNISILIVDDNPGFVQRMSGLLDEMNTITSIYSAGNFMEALMLLGQKKFDMILLDINLPGKNGISLLEQMKETGCTSQVIMLSNHSGSYYKKKCKKLGAAYFLDKTEDFEQVPATIIEVLARSEYSLSRTTQNKNRS
jgi:DNA-binding NarL/FixJ family response regulator